MIPKYPNDSVNKINPPPVEMKHIINHHIFTYYVLVIYIYTLICLSTQKKPNTHHLVGTRCVDGRVPNCLLGGGGWGGWGMMLTFLELAYMADATQHDGVGCVGNDVNVP